MSVSVIIPTFNRSDLITNAIDSVIDQNISDKEIIVIDDGSTDNTVEVLEPYREKIKLICIKNQGPAFARNVGMKAAQKKYIAFLDSDDLYFPFKLKLQCGLLDQNPHVIMAYSEMSAFSDSGFYKDFYLKTYHESAYRENYQYSSIFSHSVKLINTPYGLNALKHEYSDWLDRSVWFGNIYEKYLMKTIVFTNSMVFRRLIIDSIGLQNIRFRLFEDFEYALRICYAGIIAFIDVPAYKLRFHKGQISGPHGIATPKINIKKQRNLLNIYKHHINRYYGTAKIPKIEVHNHLGNLCRAVAISLLSYDKGTRHENVYYPIRARKYLRTCSTVGQNEHFLYFISYMPHPIRRICFKIRSILAQMFRRQFILK